MSDRYYAYHYYIVNIWSRLDLNTYTRTEKFIKYGDINQTKTEVIQMATTEIISEL